MTVVTATLNPMVDKTIDVTSVRVGETTRGTRLTASPGGKGINVARALLPLGQSVRAVTFLGGESGEEFERLCAQERIPLTIVRTESATRVGNTYRAADGEVTALFEPSPGIRREEAVEFATVTKALLYDHCHWLACCGSSPCPTTDYLFASLIEDARRLGISTALDSYGTALKSGIGAEPALVRINRHECEELFSRQLQTEHDVRWALEELVARGIGAAVITDGDRPFFAREGSTVWRVTPCPVAHVNPVGSGDCMLAGLIHGMSRGWEFAETLRCGTAMAVANAGVWDVARLVPPVVEDLLPKISIEKLS